MNVFLNAPRLFAEAFLLLFSAVGWAHWVWRVPVVRRRAGGRFFWVFLVAAGFSVGILGLQNLLYLGCRLRVTSWFAFGAALLGNLGWLHARRADRALFAGLLTGTWRAGAVGLAVFLLQGVPLFCLGAADYYGNAHVDQVNYVLTSQFIVDRPDSLHASRIDPNVEPYADQAIGFMRQRLGQSVGIGYLSVVSLGNTKSAYGVFSIALLSFGAVSAYVLLASLGIPARVAMLAGGWWGLLPAITKMHLDGFLSQTCHVWTLPLGVALFNLHRRRLGGGYGVFQSIYYAFVMSVYPEAFVINAALSTCLLVLASDAPPRRLALALVIPPMAGLLGVGWYLKFFFATLALQYGSAAGNVATLTGLVPLSGTWAGWSEMFAGTGFTPPLLQRTVILLGMGLLATMALGLLGPKRDRRRRLLLAICLAPIAVLAALASAADFPKYPFAKLLVTFTPFWIMLMVWGCYELRFFLPRVWRRPWLRYVPAALILAMIGLASADDVSQWTVVCQNQGYLAILNAPPLRRCFEYAETHKETTCIVKEEADSTITAWLVYHCRGAKTYVVAAGIADLPPLPPPNEPFRVLPPTLDRAVILSRHGVVLTEKNSSPLVQVTNPQGPEIHLDGSIFYWLGREPAGIDVLNLFAGRAPSAWNLHVEAMPGPGGPGLDRAVSLISEDHSVQTRGFHDFGALDFPVTLHAGSNHLRLQAIYPPGLTPPGPGDGKSPLVLLEKVFATPRK